MFRRFFIGFVFAIFASFFISGCFWELWETTDKKEEDVSGEYQGVGGAASFKVPVPPGYEWEVTQSWAEHCEECSAKYHDWDYCSLSHTDNCCKYGWDFNLHSSHDLGKPVLASGDGYVREVATGYNGGWGNTVVIDHGDNICTRYSHMENDSITVEEGQYVCQGLKIGQIGNEGNSDGPHLHFQFEECGTNTSIPMAFTDGNGVPMCTRGNDRYNANDEYDFLILTNEIRYDCEGGSATFSDDAYLEESGWVDGGCHSLNGCPLIPNCGRNSGHTFSDQSELDDRTAAAAAYLWSECAIDGMHDGRLAPGSAITRAEALKVAVFLFGIMGACNTGNVVEYFLDVDEDDWFYETVLCGAKYGIIESRNPYFNPNDSVSFAEAAKMLVQAAAWADVIDIKNPSEGHFQYIPSSHWAYKYVETIHAYGGVHTSYHYYSPEMSISRSNFIIMAASLSPCFCGNVSCSRGCSCNQATFSCTDPNDTNQGTGGTDDQRDNDNDRIDLVFDCYVNDDFNECLGDEIEIDTRCYVTNYGDDVVRINDLEITLEDPSDREYCRISKNDLQNGVGTQHADPGERKFLGGHFTETCWEMPPDHEIEITIDLVERIQGERTRYNDVATAVVEYEQQWFDDCGLGDCVPANCDTLDIDCGEYIDGCGGTVNCGSCAPGKECVHNFCRCSTDCDELGFECGNPTNACGDFLNCGSCPQGQTCRNGFCNCEPQTCDDLGAECGTYENGCGVRMLCGYCSSNMICEDGQCVCAPKTCAQIAEQCGVQSDGCGGTIDCGECPSNHDCIDGFCICHPKHCRELGFECGTHNDGCGGQNICGFCPTRHRCEDGQCVCMPLTCEDLGVDCGYYQDGCGNQLFCGLCTPDQCDPLSCNDLGVRCGVHDNGCGEAINCGSCPNGSACFVGECYSCDPVTCIDLGFDCGTHPDECGGVIYCGSCDDSGKTCRNGHCI